MLDQTVFVVCCCSAAYLIVALLVIGLCRAAGRTDEYLEKWEAEHGREYDQN